MELEAVTGKGLWGHKGPGSRLACSLYLRCWIEQLSACQLADRLMRTLSHSTQWGKGPYCLTSLIVGKLGDWAAFFSLLSPSLSSWTFFFLFLYFILHPICRLPSFNSHYFPFLCLFHTIYLPLCLSFFSQRWVLVYGRLSQVCCIWRRWSQYRRGGRGKLLCTLKKKKRLRI